MGKDRKEKEYRCKHFPDSIKDLLCLLAGDEGNTATIILDACEDCIQENVCVIAVIGEMAVFRCLDKFKFVNIRCICEVIVDCDTILDEILDNSDRC